MINVLDSPEFTMICGAIFLTCAAVYYKKIDSDLNKRIAFVLFILGGISLLLSGLHMLI
jgi:hypothetical protein